MKNRQASEPIPAVQDGLTCPQCGAGGIETIWFDHKLTYGTGVSAVKLPVRLPVRRCEPCDFEYLDEVGERLKHEAICAHFGVLSPWEIRRIRRDHGMTRAAFAEVTGLGEASLNRWENGLSTQTHGNDRYIRLLANPWIMKALKHIVAAANPPDHRPDPAGGRFQEVRSDDPDARREQQAFQLRPDLRRAA